MTETVHIVRGNPTDVEVAVITAVLLAQAAAHGQDRELPASALPASAPPWRHATGRGCFGTRLYRPYRRLGATAGGMKELRP
jgi:hypothetical protein